MKTITQNSDIRRGDFDIKGLDKVLHIRNMALKGLNKAPQKRLRVRYGLNKALDGLHNRLQHKHSLMDLDSLMDCQEAQSQKEGQEVQGT